MAGISDQAWGKPENRFKYNGKELNHHEFSDLSGLDWYSYGKREYDPQIGRFFRVDPLTDSFPHLTPFQYSSNDPIKNIDLDGLEGILSPFLLGTEPPIIRGPIIEEALETGSEAAETTIKTPKFTQEQLENFNRGNQHEAEQLAKNGLEKNYKPIEVVDPRTGEMGKTIPDALENGGKSTTEIKNVGKQGLTKQLRLQEKFSNDNGELPRLIINQGAKLSNPLLKSSFKIDFYNVVPPVPIDNTKVVNGNIISNPKQDETKLKNGSLIL